MLDIYEWEDMSKRGAHQYWRRKVARDGIPMSVDREAKRVGVRVSVKGRCMLEITCEMKKNLRDY